MPSPSDFSKWAEQRLIPALLGMGTLWFALLVWEFETFHLQQAPSYPSWYHLLSFVIFPLFIAAVLFLPAQNLSRLSRLRILFDSLIIIVTVATLYGYMVLIPILVASKGTLMEKRVGSLFSAVDLALLFCLLFVALQANPCSDLAGHHSAGTGDAHSLCRSHRLPLAVALDAGEPHHQAKPGGSCEPRADGRSSANDAPRADPGKTCGRGPATLLEETEVFARGKTVVLSALVLIFALLLLSLARPIRWDVFDCKFTRSF